MEPQAGLAGIGAQQGQAQGQGQGQISVEQVAQMLMQGVKPEELLAQGIPQAVIEQAIALLQAQVDQQQAQQPQQAPQEGLAGMQLPQG